MKMLFVQYVQNTDFFLKKEQKRYYLQKLYYFSFQKFRRSVCVFMFECRVCFQQ